MSAIDEGRAGARKQVEKIAEDHGYLGEDVLNDMKPEVRAKVVRALFNKDQIIASSVIALAKTVYTSSARFVFELLQNADDNSFSKARHRKQEPWVRFREEPGRIVVECNEDGFTDKDLVAICNVNRSSKQGAQGYIGEKGIGFKSVFMSAYKVHIQSGYFSFSFTHRQGDSGFGMISPVWEETGEYLGDGLTRMTLFLREDGDEEAKAMRLASIRSQFRDMQETFLLFMKNIRRIDVDLLHETDNTVISKSYTLTRHSQRALIQRTVREGDKTLTQSKHFHVTEYDATNLAKNENRTYSEDEERTRAYSGAKVVLAFPLDEQSRPIIEPQELFAFLPVRHVGLNFIVHSDWVTLTSRENIVATSLRNRGLISAVADAFLKAVLELCEHETLQYQWMRYLPSPSDIVHFDSIWKELVREISDRLKSASVLRSRSHRISRITQLRRNCSGGLDKDGNHLFEDIDPEIYLSAHYTNDDLNRLQAYGLKTMTLEHVIERARADLDMGPSRSRLMSFDTSEDWHSRVATLFSKGLSQWGHLIRTLRIIPTRTRVKNKAIFVAAQDQSQPIFHPECNGLAIPQGLGLTVLHSMAAKNPERLGLYMELGVKHATVGFIRKKILNAHLWRQGGSTMLPEDSREQLRFLYLTYHLEEKDEPDPTLKVYTADETFVDPYHEPVYLPDSEPYGVSELLRPTMRGTMPGSGAPGYRVPFINNLYLEDQPEAAGGQRLDWVAWLTVYVGVRRSIRILDRGRLSGACKYVAKYRPEKFLGFLQTCWNSEGANVLNSSMAMSELRDIEVLCDGDRMCKFSDCYFPSEEFRSRAKKYLLEDEFFPFIRIPQDDEPRVSLWTGLLHALRIGHTVTDLSFVLAIMRRLLDANEDAHSVKNPLRVLKLYEHIHATLRDADGRDNKIVRDLFDSRDSIYIPATRKRRARWLRPRRCLWSSPVDLAHSTCLEKTYTAAFGEKVDISYLQRFFADVLRVPDATWEDIVSDIEGEKDKDAKEVDVDRITNLYGCLAGLSLSNDAKRAMRARFESDAIIFVDEDGDRSWRRTTECLWSSATKIRDKATLVHLYKGLDNFFIRQLGVQEVTLQILYNELRRKTTSSPIDEVKKLLQEFSSRLSTPPSNLDPKEIQKAPVFPVRYPDGQRKLCDASVDFAIVDQQRLHDEFASKAAFFDFSLEETHQLKPFLDWVGFRSRYLSDLVTDITSVAGQQTRPVSDPTRRLNTKARALLRQVFAVHFGSPRVDRTQASQDAFVALLRTSEVLEADQIVSRKFLHQGGKELCVESNLGDLHIQSNAEKKSLCVYMTRDRRRQATCFHTTLPRELFRWIVTDPVTGTVQSDREVSQKAIGDLKSIFNVSPSLLPDVLAELGIPQIGEPDEFEEEDEGTESEEVAPGAGETDVSALANGIASLSIAETPRTPRLRALSESSTDSDDSNPVFTPSAVATTASASRDSTPLTGFGTPTSDDAFASYSARRPLLYRQPAAAPLLSQAARREIDDVFRRMIDKVVRTARSSGALPLPRAGASAVFRDPEAGGGRISSMHVNNEWKARVGVAGELFVFEFLLGLRPLLAGFTRSCWKSKLRHMVAVHPDYADLTRWTQSETTDIVYNDINGTLTERLIEAGYLDHAAWHGKTPMYGIEVKSTEGECDTPFFVSRWQQRLMRDRTIGPYRADNNCSIYIIFRVFKLCEKEIGMRLFVDPEGMRQRRELEFDAETYEVTPGVLAR